LITLAALVGHRGHHVALGHIDREHDAAAL
jgi:hypothetical protein